jgi:hypothetical protein
MKIVPAHIARLIDPAVRAELGPAVQLPSETGQGARRRSELAEQRQFAAWLKLQGDRLEYFWQRTNKRATGKIGTPDFIVALAGGKTLWLEMKSPGNYPTTEQAETLRKLAQLGHQARICHSAAEAIELIRASSHEDSRIPS